MKRFLTTSPFFAVLLTLGLLLPAQAVYGQNARPISPKKDKKTQPDTKKKTPAKKTPAEKPTYLEKKLKNVSPLGKGVLPKPEEVEKITKSFKSLLQEAKNMGMKSSTAPTSAWGILKISIAPIQGSYKFIRYDIKKLPTLAKDLQNFQRMDGDTRAATALKAARVLVHAVDVVVTARISIKVGVKLAKNLRSHWKLGPTKAIPLAIVKTAATSRKDLQAYLSWAKYSYQIKGMLTYIEKNYDKLKGKMKKVMKELNKLMERLQKARQGLPQAKQ